MNWICVWIRDLDLEMDLDLDLVLDLDAARAFCKPPSGWLQRTAPKDNATKVQKGNERIHRDSDLHYQGGESKNERRRTKKQVHSSVWT